MKVQIAVIGAGPAGLAAATLAAQKGAQVTLYDEQAAPGGQIYRGLGTQSLTDPGILGEDYYHGQTLLDGLTASNVTHLTGASVWQVTPDRQIGVTRDGTTQMHRADQIILATGAMERPSPLPGWTLPGVMMAGAAQIMLKTSGVAMPGAVFIGSGPLLYLITLQYLRAGVPVAAVLETTPRGNMLGALRYLPGALSQMNDLIKGLGWLREIAKSDVPFIRGVHDVRLIGDDAVTAVEYRQSGGWKRFTTDHVFLHQGIVPNINLAMAAGCNHKWNPLQLCWTAETDKWGHTNLSGIAIAGDGASITGAKAAEHAGRLAALGALNRLGRIEAATRDILAEPERTELPKHLKLRPFLDALYQPAPQFRTPDDDTIVCRCEELTAGTIRKAVDAGCLGPNQLKSFTRAGMGPCQGRFCQLTIAQIIAQERGQPTTDIAQPRLRAPIKPLTLGELAQLQTPDQLP